MGPVPACPLRPPRCGGEGASARAQACKSGRWILASQRSGLSRRSRRGSLSGSSCRLHQTQEPPAPSCPSRRIPCSPRPVHGTAAPPPRTAPRTAPARPCAPQPAQNPSDLPRAWGTGISYVLSVGCGTQ
ncbi:translation initiation factor IF-2-like [Onychomys torridus]|uniref:translation initiation factor IF-2-like n=1 Tax=Onychomys torridus TaxID=38674 RepID=UPI00167F709A|nr:translation initiation factor IF-2-like [Onychomys torridus]